jgi:N-acetyl-anhydromuramyl-L-alanine amidase AmpD
VVGPNGEVAQLVDLVNAAQHAESHYNGRSIGIETVVSANDPDAWTDNPLLLERLTELVAWLTAEFDIPVEHPAPDAMLGTAFDHPGILAHSQMSTSGKTDPGGSVENPPHQQ